MHKDQHYSRWLYELNKNAVKAYSIKSTRYLATYSLCAVYCKDKAKMQLIIIVIDKLKSKIYALSQRSENVPGHYRRLVGAELRASRALHFVHTRSNVIVPSPLLDPSCECFCELLAMVNSVDCRFLTLSSFARLTLHG